MQSEIDDWRRVIWLKWLTMVSMLNKLGGRSEEIRHKQNLLHWNHVFASQRFRKILSSIWRPIGSRMYGFISLYCFWLLIPDGVSGPCNNLLADSSGCQVTLSLSQTYGVFAGTESLKSLTWASTLNREHWTTLKSHPCWLLMRRIPKMTTLWVKRLLSELS